MSEFDDNPEIEAAAEIMRLRRICNEHLLQFDDVEPEDVEKIFDDADGDPGDVVSSLYALLLELGEDPDELLAEWGALEPGAETE